VPHGAIAISASGRDTDRAEARATQEAYLELGARLRETGADRVVVLTPHNVHVEGRFAVVDAGRLSGNLADWGNGTIVLDAIVDRPFATELKRELGDAELPVTGVSYGGNDLATATHPMDWATLIPLWYLGGRFQEPLPAVVVTPSRERTVAEHEAAGKAIARAAARAGGRTAIVASCDHGHGHRASGPYGFRPESAVYDDRVVELLRQDRLAEVAGIDADLVRDAAADSWWQMLMLSGALGSAWHPELLSYEHPTYFGMAVCGFTRSGLE
ncbi:MAG: extradiol ring-cleavage dioxygenase, partial [Candidatus Dormibacteraceae bacterium]